LIDGARRNDCEKARGISCIYIAGGGREKVTRGSIRSFCDKPTENMVLAKIIHNEVAGLSEPPT
jgi:hypothetical protein